MQAALLAAAVAAAVLSSRGASASVEAAKERVMELANSDDMVNFPPPKKIHLFLRKKCIRKTCTRSPFSSGSFLSSTRSGSRRRCPGTLQGWYEVSLKIFLYAEKNINKFKKG